MTLCRKYGVYKALLEGGELKAWHTFRTPSWSTVRAETMQKLHDQGFLTEVKLKGEGYENELWQTVFVLNKAKKAELIKMLKVEEPKEQRRQEREAEAERIANEEQQRRWRQFQ